MSGLSDIAVRKNTRKRDRGRLAAGTDGIIELRDPKSGAPPGTSLGVQVKPRRVPKNLSWVHLGFGVTLASYETSKDPLGDGRYDRIEFRSNQPA